MKKKIFAAVSAGLVAAVGVLFGTGTIQVTAIQNGLQAVGSFFGLN